MAQPVPGLWCGVVRPVAAALGNRSTAARHDEMTARPVPAWHWHSYDTDPLSTHRLRRWASPQRVPWFIHMECSRCG
jgi:hypothetical protein